ncbi:MAG: hypothetical protein U5L96_06280 [Owenweeksia sp.]|nr:hypothetical protein [Owenweeksia sp.]
MKTLLLGILICCSMGLMAQQYLYIKKGNEFPDKKYGLKERITFKTDSAAQWSEGLIDEVSGKYIVISGVQYSLEAITAVRSERQLLKIAGTALWAGGLLFTGIAIINGVINNDAPLVRNSQLAWGGGLVVAGIVMDLLSRKTYRADAGWNWVTIDLQKMKSGE